MKSAFAQSASLFAGAAIATLISVDASFAHAGYQRTPANITLTSSSPTGLLAIVDSDTYNKNAVTHVYADMAGAGVGDGISFKLCSASLGATSVNVCDSATSGTGSGYQNPDLCPSGCSAWTDASNVGNYAWVSVSPVGTGGTFDGIYEAF